LTEDSPCIDAGDPASGSDPDGSVADMGAHYYQVNAVGDAPESIIPGRIELLSCAPNPFNESAEVTFTAANQGSVSVKLYNITGRIVNRQTIDAEPGMNKFRLTGETAVTGVYFLSLESGASRTTMKVVLLK